MIEAAHVLANPSEYPHPESLRAVGRAFVDGEDWTKRQLVTWLEGPYREVAVPATQEEIDAAVESKRHSTLRPVAESTVVLLLIQTRTDVIAALEHLMTGDTSFVRACAVNGSIGRFTLEDGSDCFLPMHRPKMKLTERVLSLFAADYLNDSDAYRESLSICEHCGSISFEEQECVHVDSGFYSPGSFDDHIEEEQVSFIQVG